MDNALIIDGLIVVILLAGALIGAHRGLFKSLMGLVVVVAALFGSVLLAGILADPITDVIAPRVEDAVVRQFSDELDKKEQEEETAGRSSLTELLEKYGLSGDALDGVLKPLTEAVQSLTGQAKERAEDAFRSAISASIRKMVYGTVHAVLVLVLYVVLLIVLKLLTRTLDHVFDLPVLGTLNGVGGAALGLLEAALLVYVVVFVTSHLGVRAVTEHAGDTYLLPIFLNHSPVELILSLSGKD